MIDHMFSFKIMRYVVAYVFIVSGLMKLLDTGLGNFFVSLGLPFPTFLLYAVALTEIICGIFIILNIKVKLASIPLLAIMIGAIVITKLPTLSVNVMKFLFDARLDIVMLAILIMLYRQAPNK
ncbi:DoxX family protein [Bacillus niameyensis]|uniref:DoxX family protein n=1 Tax=Bacillus niameyensis TaxID=1522308 RepID=UPI000A8EEFA1|nr:DoxX family protein [Bacillus niameyensis]